MGGRAETGENGPPFGLAVRGGRSGLNDHLAVFYGSILDQLASFQGSLFHAPDDEDADFLGVNFINDPERFPENFPNARIALFRNHPGGPGKGPDMLQRVLNGDPELMSGFRIELGNVSQAFA
jgi:hypothetical protein